jgi:hypothetical protein
MDVDMKHAQKKLFREEILKVLRSGPKTTAQIYLALKRKYPKHCNDTQKHFGARLKWKHDVSNLFYDMQKEFLIYLNKSKGVWKIVEE